MTPVHLTKTKRGFGGDNYTYMTGDHKTIVLSLGFGLMCPPRIALNFGDVLFGEKRATYGDWSEMLEQGRNFLREHGYDPDEMPDLRGKT